MVSFGGFIYFKVYEHEDMDVSNQTPRGVVSFTDNKGSNLKGFPGGDNARTRLGHSF